MSSRIAVIAIDAVRPRVVADFCLLARNVQEARTDTGSGTATTETQPPTG